MALSASERSSDELQNVDGDYRSISKTAVLGLVFGLLSPLAIIDLPLWLVPIIGIAINAVALVRLRGDTVQSGRNVALAGLGLSVLFIVAPAVQRGVSEIILARQGRAVVDRFFKCLRERRPEQALMATFATSQRPASEEAIWFKLRHDDDANRRIRNFVKYPLVRTLLTLGDKADIRFYKTKQVGIGAERAQVVYLYTVTFTDDAGKKKTFFVHIVGDRTPAAKEWQSPWKVGDFGVADPP